jgi:carbamoyltransferase
MRYVDHHLAAISAYSYSGLGIPPWWSWMAGVGSYFHWHGHDGRSSMCPPFLPDSVRYFYSEFTEFLGFQRYSDEWKVMGLAPYGQPGIDLSSFIDLQADPYRVHVRKLVASGGEPFAEMTKSLGPVRVAESEITDQHKNIAYAVQEACEIAMMNVVKMAVQKTGSRNLCMAGGVALIQANGKIAHGTR